MPFRCDCAPTACWACPQAAAVPEPPQYHAKHGHRLSAGHRRRHGLPRTAAVCLTRRSPRTSLLPTPSWYGNMRPAARLTLSTVFVIPWWIAAWAPPHALAGDAMPTAAGRTPAEIPGINGLVDAASTEVKRTGNPSRIAEFDDVRDVMTHATEWRWYSRDNGILLAIPIRERLGIVARAEGEKTLADVVRRLINQAGWGNPPVQVILVGTEEPCHQRLLCPPCGAAVLPATCSFN